jgi:methionine biosynthesis protein MetW
MTTLRPDLAIIADNVARGSRVLDVGCGDGTLLAALRDRHGCDARGMEIDAHNVAECVALDH